MSVSLFKLPIHLLLDIVKKMETKSICRIRQTCKKMDEFVEDTRSRIATRREDSPWILSIRMLNNRIGGPIRFEFVLFNSPSGPDFAEQCPRIPAEASVVSIEDPVRQLSAISLRTLEICDYTSKQNPRERILDQGILVLLRQLRLNVQWLCIQCKVTPELLSSANYAKLRIDSCWTFPLENLLNIGIKNSCMELSLNDCEGNIMACAKLFTRMDKVSISLFEMGRGDRFLKDFLKATKYNRAKLGNLKALTINCRSRDHTRFPGLSLILEHIERRIFQRFDLRNVYSYEMEHGEAIIVEKFTNGSDKNFDVHFVEESTREELFEICWKYSEESDRTKEDSLREFIGAEDEREAIYRLWNPEWYREFEEEEEEEEL